MQKAPPKSDRATLIKYVSFLDEEAISGNRTKDRGRASDPLCMRVKVKGGGEEDVRQREEV